MSRKVIYLTKVQQAREQRNSQIVAEYNESEGSKTAIYDHLANKHGISRGQVMFIIRKSKAQ